MKRPGWACPRESHLLPLPAMERENLRVPTPAGNESGEPWEFQEPHVLEKVLSGGRTAPPGEPFLVKVVLHPGRWKNLASDMDQAYEEAARRACLKALAEVFPFRGMGLDPVHSALGCRFRCPGCWTRTFTAAGEPACPLHGTLFRPLQPTAPSPVSATAPLPARVKEGPPSLRFE